MSAETKYYSGPDGVFYDDHHDRIFLLKRSDRWVIDKTTGEILAPRYHLIDESGIYAFAKITDWLEDELIRLDDFPKFKREPVWGKGF